VIVSDAVMVLASDAPPGLLPARQQMAVSLGFHIILACFGVAFPTMIYVMHRRGIVRDDPIALRLAKRWSKASAVLFAIGLLASGLASASVGAYAGAMIMQGLLHRSIPMLARRLVTLCPAVAILALGLDPTRTLVLSQVVLSFGIPFAVLPLIRLTSNRKLMGTDTNHPVTTLVGWAVGIMISLLNMALIWLTVTG